MQQIRKVLNEKAHHYLDVIESLEKQIMVLKRKKFQSDKDLNKLRSRHNDLKAPLERAKSEIFLLDERREVYLKRRQNLLTTQIELKGLCNRLKDMKWKYEIMFQNFQTLEKETYEYQFHRTNTLIKLTLSRL